MAIDMAPCQWRREQQQYVVHRNGYILFSFFELGEDARVDGASKKTFVLTAKNLDSLLGLNIHAPYNEADQNEELILYKPVDSVVMQIMKVTKNEDLTYNFTYCEMAEDKDEEIQSYNDITLKPGQVRMIQVMCEYGLPALSGFHAIGNPNVIG